MVVGLPPKAPSRNLIGTHSGGLSCIKFLAAVSWQELGLDSTYSFNRGIKRSKCRNVAIYLRFSHLSFVVAIKECSLSFTLGL